MPRQDPLRCRLDVEGGGEFQLDISAVAFSKPRSTAPFCTGLSAHRFDSNSHICLSASLPKPMGQVRKVTRKSRKREAISFFPHPFTKRFRSCSFGQRIATAIKLASITLPLENSPPQCLTSSMITLDAEHRFRRI